MTDSEWLTMFPRGKVDLLWRTSNSNERLYIRWSAEKTISIHRWGEYCLKMRPHGFSGIVDNNRVKAHHLEDHFIGPLHPTAEEIILFNLDHNIEYPIKPNKPS